MKKGDFLYPSFYMEVNGKKISGVVLEVNHEAKTARVFLSNGKDCWYDQKTIVDLFDVVKV